MEASKEEGGSGRKNNYVFTKVLELFAEKEILQELERIMFMTIISQRAPFGPTDLLKSPRKGEM